MNFSTSLSHSVHKSHNVNHDLSTVKYTEIHRLCNCYIARQIIICLDTESGIHVYACLECIQRICGRSLFAVRWCFEPSQPHRITSGLIFVCSQTHPLSNLCHQVCVVFQQTNITVQFKFLLGIDKGRVVFRSASQSVWPTTFKISRPLRRLVFR